jgi:REP element-mobilizing transposase RayT
MNQNFPIHCSQFFTATIYEWNHLLNDNKHKNIIINSLKFLVADKRIELNTFIIMSNHIHLIWQPLFGYTPSGIQSSFMKYTAQQLKRSLLENDAETLSVFKVNKYDREYQIWKREPLSIELISGNLFKQKLQYHTLQSGESGIMRKANPSGLLIYFSYLEPEIQSYALEL